MQEDNTIYITEADTVQSPMVNHAAEIGWTPLTPQEAKEKRGGVDGMFFREELETKLGQFNPWMYADAIRQVIERLEAVPPTIKGNREMLAWLRGERQMYDEDERRSRRGQFPPLPPPGGIGGPEARREMILALLDRARDGLTRREIHERLGPGVTERQVRRALEELRDRGLIFSTNRGPLTRWQQRTR